jgi:hypothetical protein
VRSHATAAALAVSSPPRSPSSTGLNTSSTSLITPTSSVLKKTITWHWLYFIEKKVKEHQDSLCTLLCHGGQTGVHQLLLALQELHRFLQSTKTFTQTTCQL